MEMHKTEKGTFWKSNREMIISVIIILTIMIVLKFLFKLAFAVHLA